VNQRIFITGGASGLGRALARQYAARGWRVCIGDINQEAGEVFARTLSTDTAKTAFVSCDVTSFQDQPGQFAEIHQRSPDTADPGADQ